jgi:hypothetical protein
MAKSSQKADPTLVFAPPPAPQPAPLARRPANTDAPLSQAAASSVAQVREAMLALRYGDADASWLAATRPAVQALRDAADRSGKQDAKQALEMFAAAIEAVDEGPLGETTRVMLLARYQRLVDLAPAAFELDVESARREKIIIEALLQQIEGVERPTIDRLRASGLDNLERLMMSTSESLEEAGIRRDLADAMVDHLRAFRASVDAAVSAREPVMERHRLGNLLIMLSLQNDGYAHASSEWTEDARERKRRLRKERDQTFLQIKVMLARLGERAQLAELEPLPFSERIARIDRYLSAVTAPA